MFDIDKMFLARYNYTINDKGRLEKVTYDAKLFLGKNGVYNVTDENIKEHDKRLLNLLLDLFNAVLLNDEHFLAANTPLDVSTGPLKAFSEQIASATEDNVIDGHWLSAVFQTEQKMKNAASDGGIGPMALNSTFRYHIQTADLRLYKNKYLTELGINNINKTYDVNGQDILDATSALINAHVDAVKDNFIGRMNVNSYTYDITSFLTTTGFGFSTFAFLSQPGIVELSNEMLRLQSSVVTDPEQDPAGIVRYNILESYGNTKELASAEMMTLQALNNQRSTPKAMRDDEWHINQRRYLNTFLYLKELAEGYRLGINVAQIDTKKFGNNANELISFMQMVEDFQSPYNLTFSNPKDLYDKTFLGLKYESAVKGMFDTYGNLLLDFTTVYKDAADRIMKDLNKTGLFGKKLLAKIGPRIKTVMMLPFFNQYIQERFGFLRIENGKEVGFALGKLLSGENSVTARLGEISQRAAILGEGQALFDVIAVRNSGEGLPKFMSISPRLRDSEVLKNSVQSAIAELANSNDEKTKQWALDFIAYMFYISGGTDTFMGDTKTTLYDIIPPSALNQLTLKDGTTLSDFMETSVKNKELLTDGEIDLIMRLSATVDEVVPIVSKSRGYWVNYAKAVPKDLKSNTEAFTETDRFVLIKKGANNLFDYNRGKFLKFILVPSKNRKINDVYLFKYVTVNKWNGKTYMNPVYEKIQQVGYKNPLLAAESVKADGIVQPDGTIKSLMRENKVKPEIPIEVVKRAFGIKPEQVLIPVTEFEQHSLKNDEELGIADRHYAFVNSLDAIYYYADGRLTEANRDIIGYAKYLGKKFKLIESDSTEVSGFEGTNRITILFNNGVGSSVKSSVEDMVQKANKQASLIISDDTANTSDIGVNTKINATVTKFSGEWNRDSVADDNSTLYVFTDNTDRDSGSGKIDDSSWYSQKYGKGKHHPTNQTTAVIRGLSNARPISTQKHYNDQAKGAKGRWEDSDVEEFKKVIRAELDDIVDAWNTGKYSRIMFPSGDGLFNANISQITKSRTPALYDALSELLKEYGFEMMIPKDNLINISVFLLGLLLSQLGLFIEEYQKLPKIMVPNRDASYAEFDKQRPDYNNTAKISKSRVLLQSLIKFENFAYVDITKLDVSRKLKDQINDLQRVMLNSESYNALKTIRLTDRNKAKQLAQELHRLQLKHSEIIQKIVKELFNTDAVLELNYSSATERMQRNLESGPETKINIYAGTNENADLSNFAVRPFTITNVGFEPDGPINGTFKTVEGAFQAQKLAYSSLNDSKKEMIRKQLETANGAQARTIGRKISGLDTKAWDNVSSGLMKNLLKASFKQNPQAAQRLINTGDATLTHTQDKGKWGKEFPKLLMEVRNELKGELLSRLCGSVPF